jgi:hypothetical protein
LRDGAFWKIGADDLLTLGQELEMLSRSVYAVKVHLAGEVDTQALATPRGCPSTAALLRQVLLISPTEAPQPGQSRPHGATAEHTSSTRSTVMSAAWINFALLGRVGQKSSLSSMPGKLIHARRGNPRLAS